MSDEEEESDDDFDFDYEQFLLAVQVQKYYYRGFYPRGIFVIWSLLRADCYDLSGCDDYGIPPIVYASKCGSVILLRLLLYYKADINALSKLRETALIAACRNKRMRVVRFLLKRGAQIDLVDRSGYSALRWAVLHEHVNMVNLLLQFNASVTKDCYTTGSALDIARKGISEDHALILKALEGKLVTEREALLVEIVATKKKKGPLEEIEEYRKKRQAQQEAEAAEKATTSNSLEATTQAKPTHMSRRARQKILAVNSSKNPVEQLISRGRPVDVGTRVHTPLEHARELKQSLDDNDDSPSSAWIRVGAGKWRPRDHLQQTELSSGETTATEVETFAADKQGVRELLTSDGKWQVFLGQQMQLSPAKSSVSQGHLTIEDFE